MAEIQQTIGFSILPSIMNLQQIKLYLEGTAISVSTIYWYYLVNTAKSNIFLLLFDIADIVPFSDMQSLFCGESSNECHNQ